MFEDDHNERSADPCPLALSQIIRVPERLVGLGFRHWFAGYQSGDVHCWETAWGVYERALGEKGARLAVAELSSWVKAVRASARRDITVFITETAAASAAMNASRWRWSPRVSTIPARR